MKKLYSLITILLCFFVSGVTVNAQTTTEDIPLTFCINIDDPSVCQLIDSNYQPVELQKGENVFTIMYHMTTYTDGSTYGYSDTYYLNIKDDLSADYRFTACTVLLPGATEPVPYEGFRSATPSLPIYMSPEMDGCIFYPTVSNLEELRTATAIVNVDDASNVRLRCGYSGYSPTLVDGENLIKFNPIDEANWTIGTIEYNTYLGGVTLNGEEVPERYGTYDLYVTDGSVIDIIGAATLEPVTVTFSFVNPDTEAAVKAVYKYINYETIEVADWQNGFTIDPYSQIVVSLDQNTYNISSLTVNGVPEQLYSDNVYITISKDSQIVIDAAKYSTFDITLTVTDPAHLDIGVAESMYAGSTPLIGLVPGTQVVTISDKNAYMIVNAITGCIIDRVAYVAKGSTTETVVEAGYSGYYVPLTDTESVIIESHALVRDHTATLWVNDINKCYSLSLTLADGTTCFSSYNGVAPVTGSQTFAFDANSDNPVSLYFSPMDYENPGYVLINDQLIAPKYEGSTSYEFDIKDGDVIKVYIGETAPSSSIIDITTAPVDNSVYTIMGVKVAGSTLAPGLYIINGKKFLVK